MSDLRRITDEDIERIARRVLELLAAGEPAVGDPVDHEALGVEQATYVGFLRQWSEAHDGETPTQSEWVRSRPEGAPSEKRAYVLFGGWAAACRAAGLTPRGPGRNKRNSRVGRAIRQSDMERM